MIRGKEDHDIGYDVHHDGEIATFIEGELGYVEDVPSHLFYDQATAFLYIADTGNNRIDVLDTESGTRGRTCVTPLSRTSLRNESTYSS